MHIELEHIQYENSTVLPPTLQDAEKNHVGEANKLLTEQLGALLPGHTLLEYPPTTPILEWDIMPTQLRYCTQAMHNALMNTQSDHQHPVFANAEFTIKRPHSNTLLVVVGESWCYGGKIRDMNDTVYGESPLSFSHALHRTMGAVASELLGADLYQYAYPGNNNFTMLYWLEQNLPLIVQQGYERVRVLFQFTDQVREMGQPQGIWNLVGEHSDYGVMLDQLCTGHHTWDNYEHWQHTYWAFCHRKLNHIISNNTCELTVWGNFSPPRIFDHRLYNIIPESWSQFNAAIEGYSIPNHDVSNSGWHRAVFVQQQDLDAVETTVQHEERLHHYWDNISPRTHNLHVHYPSTASHRLWAGRITQHWRGETLPSVPQIFGPPL